MKKYLLILTMFVAVAFGVAAHAETEKKDIPLISARIAYKNFIAGKGILVDSMAKGSYEKNHLIGSINLPNDGRSDLENLRQMQLPFPIDQEIYVFCG